MAAPPHLLIAELAPPDMDGLQLAERLSARWSSLRVLLVSGDCHDVVFLSPKMANRASFVRKPVATQAVVLRAAALLEAA
jgi:DNA-binding response OmpR family regulator